MLYSLSSFKYQVKKNLHTVLKNCLWFNHICKMVKFIETNKKIVINIICSFCLLIWNKLLQILIEKV